MQFNPNTKKWLNFEEKNKKRIRRIKKEKEFLVGQKNFVITVC